MSPRQPDGQGGTLPSNVDRTEPEVCLTRCADAHLTLSSVRAEYEVLRGSGDLVAAVATLAHELIMRPGDDP